jgi:stress-induced morphogen
MLRCWCGCAVEVVDESYKHNVPRGTESHFKVTIVSEAFEGVKLLDRHRAVNTALEAEFEAGLHALSISVCGVNGCVIVDSHLITSLLSSLVPLYPGEGTVTSCCRTTARAFDAAVPWRFEEVVRQCLL